MENKRRAWRAALRTLSPRREAHRTLDPSFIYALRPDVHELRMEAEVPPASKKSEAAQPENLGRGTGETGETDRT